MGNSTTKPRAFRAQQNTSHFLRPLVFQHSFANLCQNLGIKHSILLFHLNCCLLRKWVNLVFILLIQNRHSVQQNKSCFPKWRLSDLNNKIKKALYLYSMYTEDLGVLTYIKQGQEIAPTPNNGKNPQASNNLKCIVRYDHKRINKPMVKMVQK